jgi:hypothetical protein
MTSDIWRDTQRGNDSSAVPSPRIEMKPIYIKELFFLSITEIAMREAIQGGFLRDFTPQFAQPDVSAMPSRTVSGPLRSSAV